MRSIPIGQYYPAESIVHRADPRVKILLVLIFSIALFAVGNLTAFALTLGLILALAGLGKIPVKLLVRGLKPIMLILLFALVMNAFFTPGPTLKLFFLRVSANGLKVGVFVSIRLALLLVGTSLLTFTSTPIELTDGMEYLMTPLKKAGVPAHELAMMMTIALRFIPTLVEEADKLMKAQAARGADFESGNLVRRAKSFIPVLIPLFIGVFRRADELASAMEARGYRGGEGRTRLRELRMRRTDWIALVAMTVVIIAITMIGRLPIV